MVCCGLTTLDVVHEVDSLPAADEKVVARDVLLEPGGPAANAARVIRALGGRALLVTALGQGPLAAVLRTALAGIEIVDLAPAGHQPPVSSVLVSGTSRAVVSVNASRLTSPAPAHLPDDVAAVLVDGHLMDAAVSLAVTARRSGIPVVLDGGSWKPRTEALLPHIDVAAVSADFAPPGGGDVLMELRAAGARVALRTDGPRPIEILTPTGGYRVDVPAPAAVVDTLGAGDVFHGALALALARGAEVVAAVRTAAAVASRSVGHRGVLGFQASASEEA